MAVTDEDLDAVRAQWEEWVGDDFDLDVIVVGEHQAARMDGDRPLGAIVSATLSLRLVIRTRGRVIFDEACPYDGRALRASVAVLARTIATSATG